MKILAVKTHTFSDILLTSAALRALRAGYPDAHITFLTSREYAAPSRGLPGIDRVAQMPVRRLLKKNPIAYLKSLRTIARDKYDLAVLFQPAPYIIRLLERGGISSVFAPLPPGESGEGLAGWVPWKPDADEYIANVYTDLAIVAGGKNDGAGLSYEVDPAVKSTEELTGLSPGERYAVVFCSAEQDIFGRIPVPPPNAGLFSEVIRDLAGKYGDNILLLGYGSEKRRIEELAEKAGAGRSLAGKFDRMETARVVEGADYVVSTDAYPLHLAVAFGKPGPGIFTASNPKARLPKDSRIRAVAPGAECAPCFANRSFPGCSSEDKFACVREIELG